MTLPATHHRLPLQSIAQRCEQEHRLEAYATLHRRVVAVGAGLWLLGWL